MSVEQDSDICMCGHVRANHGEGFIAPCTAKNCDCKDFELADEEDLSDEGASDDDSV